MAQGSLQSVVHVYAQAVFELALAAEQTELMRRQFDVLAEVIAKDTDFAEFLANPSIRRSEKAEILSRVFRGRFSDLMMDFLGVLGSKDRLGLLGEIAAEYGKLEDAHAGRVTGTAVTAVVLSQHEESRLAEQIGRILQKTVKLTIKVNPAILGGMVLTVGDKVWDSSVRSSLAQFGRKLRHIPDQRLSAQG